MKITGTGSYLPPYVLTNKMLEDMVETSDEWIVKRTGIRERHISKEMTILDMALEAAKEATKNNKQIDMIIGITSTPDYYFPCFSARLAKELLLDTAICFDITAACTGFLTALTIADSFLLSNRAERILVVASEELSNIIDYTDRNTCVLFGDAAAAFLVEKDEREITSYISSHNNDWEYLYQKIGKEMFMDGREVYKFATSAMPEAIEKVLEKSGKTLDDVKFIIPHQANLRIIDAVIHKFNLPKEKVKITIDKTGNTSSSTIPYTIDGLVRSGELQKGDLIIMTAFGAGLLYGAILLEW